MHIKTKGDTTSYKTDPASSLFGIAVESACPHWKQVTTVNSNIPLSYSLLFTSHVHILPPSWTYFFIFNLTVVVSWMNSKPLAIVLNSVLRQPQNCVCFFPYSACGSSFWVASSLRPIIYHVQEISNNINDNIFPILFSFNIKIFLYRDITSSFSFIFPIQRLLSVFSLFLSPFVPLMLASNWLHRYCRKFCCITFIYCNLINPVIKIQIFYTRQFWCFCVTGNWVLKHSYDNRIANARVTWHSGAFAQQLLQWKSNKTWSSY
jgi:hypothetical protein